ncbi:O-methylsterigmatocystin oxidoreductase [Massariosphaeria phaeospora]|uniref:O-methylsterigmatocystin oxidoreductase n=1 Tax=Massariosphaeria phaeospora TaxID=100035 RepID=A0A7C8I0M9_9PLEO|nr:O-methylsterigmatocystin oxidoreductase [Massariosphaeria phaeospora]
MTLFNSTFTIGGLAVLFFAIVWIRAEYKSSLRTLPGPKWKYPVIGIGFALPPRPIHVFRQWAQEYGEIFRIRVGWYDWVVINSPEAFKEIFDKQSRFTSSKLPAPIGHGIVTGDMRIFTMPYGPKWRSHRSTMHRLLDPKMTLTFVPSQEFEVKQFLYQLAFDNEDQNKFFQHIRRLSFSIVMTSTYGRRVDSTEHEDLRAAAKASALLGKISRPGAFIEDEIPPLALLPEWAQPSRKKAKEYYKIVLKGKMQMWERLCDEVKRGVAPPSFGKSLYESNFRDEGLTDEDAAWIVGGLIEAGAEITAVVLQNLILYLAATPQAQARAYEEIKHVVGSGRSPRFDDLPNLPYVRATVKEILRLCPVPTWAVKHFTDGEVVYKQHRIPKGTVILANTSFIHFDPARFDEPHKFKPERFINHTRSSAEYAVASDPYERDQFTFGGGRRICPAIRLATNTLEITAVSLLWAFNIKPPVSTDAGGGQKEGIINTGDTAFEPTSFRAPKPYAVRFVPRDKSRANTVRHQWERAAAEGYQLRGLDVDLNGVVTE